MSNSFCWFHSTFYFLTFRLKLLPWIFKWSWVYIFEWLNSGLSIFRRLSLFNFGREKNIISGDWENLVDTVFHHDVINYSWGVMCFLLQILPRVANNFGSLFVWMDPIAAILTSSKTSVVIFSPWKQNRKKLGELATYTRIANSFVLDFRVQNWSCF